MVAQVVKTEKPTKLRATLLLFLGKKVTSTRLLIEGPIQAGD